MKRILSTKRLDFSQKELLPNTGIGLVEYDAIEIEYLDENLPKNVKNAIFSSKNAFFGLKNHKNGLKSTKIENCFCVGESTASILVKNGQNVVKTAKNASKLANFIINRYKNESFHFFCGNFRRNEIPDTLRLNNIEVAEIQTYTTQLNEKELEGEFDAVLFFSPSGVISYASKNAIGGSVAVCIGDTTASEAAKLTKKVAVANSTTVTSTIAKAVKILLND